MYNNPYMYNYPNNYNQQNINDRIDSQIAQLQQMKEQLKNQSGGITQNFQLTPAQNGIKYANNIDEVQRDMVIGDTPYFAKDMSVVWVKNTKGDIKTYELTEIIPKESKDLMIENLQAQLDEMRKEINNAKSNDEHITTTNQSSQSADVSNVKTNARKSK